MTLAYIVRCDGTPEVRPTIPLGQCRASYPARATDAVNAVAEAVDHGWTIRGAGEFCPSCSRYLN